MKNGEIHQFKIDRLVDKVVDSVEKSLQKVENTRDGSDFAKCKSDKNAIFSDKK